MEEGFLVRIKTARIKLIAVANILFAKKHTIMMALSLALIIKRDILIYARKNVWPNLRQPSQSRRRQEMNLECGNGGRMSG